MTTVDSFFDDACEIKTLQYNVLGFPSKRAWGIVLFHDFLEKLLTAHP